MAPDSPITMRLSMKRKLSDRDEILQKWRTDRNFKADGDYREKCETINADAEKVIIEHSHQSKIPGITVNKKFKKSSCANDALKNIIQECIGRLDKIDRDFESYKKTSSFGKSSEFLSREEKSCCKCTCFLKEKSSKTKEQQENNTIAKDSKKEKNENGSSHSETIEVPSEIFSIDESDTVPAALQNGSSQKSLVESTEMLPHKLLDICQTSQSTVPSPENSSNKSSQNLKIERFETIPIKEDLFCIASEPNNDLSCNTPASKDDLSCNTPATNKIKVDTRSKSKEFWFEASIHNFENSPTNVQRGRPSIHILKDRRIVQSLAKQFS